MGVMARRDGVACEEYKTASKSDLNSHVNFERWRYQRFDDVIAEGALLASDEEMTSLFYPDLQKPALKRPATSRIFLSIRCCIPCKKRHQKQLTPPRQSIPL
jgi:hypothetical protein